MNLINHKSSQRIYARNESLHTPEVLGVNLYGTEPRVHSFRRRDLSLIINRCTARHAHARVESPSVRGILMSSH